ncbi:hypothetical protein J4436_03785 [Candidatus Woesearchaeota archaeon]|nr:hypothetical protein [Candidatus Woesearchaeota archaeon]
MPHQCVKCDRIFEDGSDEILKGCNGCGGKFFFFIKSKTEKNIHNLSLEEKENIEKDVLDILGINSDDKLIVLDLASINITKSGKFELDIAKLFKKEPIVYMLDEGKYIIDVGATFANLKEKNKVNHFL